MVEVDDDVQIARRGAGRFVHDRHLFLLRAALERVTQAEEPGRHDRSGCRTTKAVDRPLPRDWLFLALGGVVVVEALGLVAREVVHVPTVRRISRGTTSGVACPDER